MPGTDFGTFITLHLKAAKHIASYVASLSPRDEPMLHLTKTENSKRELANKDKSAARTE